MHGNILIAAHNSLIDLISLFFLTTAESLLPPFNMIWDSQMNQACSNEMILNIRSTAFYFLIIVVFCCH